MTGKEPASGSVKVPSGTDPPMVHQLPTFGRPAYPDRLAIAVPTQPIRRIHGSLSRVTWVQLRHRSVLLSWQRAAAQLVYPLACLENCCKLEDSVHCAIREVVRGEVGRNRSAAAGARQCKCPLAVS